MKCKICGSVLTTFRQEERRVCSTDCFERLCNERTCLKVSLTIMVGLIVLAFVTGCTTPSNHRLLCYNKHIDIDITAAWLCHPSFRRQPLSLEEIQNG